MLYRHFDSKDALLREMYLRDARWAATRLTKRLAGTATPVQAVEWWIDEIFSFTRDRDAPSASRCSARSRAAAPRVWSRSRAMPRELLIAPLRLAIEHGTSDGVFTVDDVDVASELIAAATMHAAGLSVPYRVGSALGQQATTAFCLAALRHAP